MVPLRKIVVEAQTGDPYAFDQLVLRFQDMAVGYAHSILGDFHLAEDAAQDAFVEAFRLLPQLEQADAFPGWFRRIVFKFCDRMTRGQRLHTVSIEDSLELPDMNTPEMDTIERQERQFVQDTIAALPDLDRNVITLYYMSELTQKEVAAFLEIPVSRVNNRLHAARKKLKERMIEMVKDTLNQNAPSRDDSFAKSVNVLSVFDAIEQGDTDRLKKIVAVRPELATIDHPVPDHRTEATKPIHYAVRANQPEIVGVLMDAGASPIVEYHINGRVASGLRMARDLGHQSILDTILAKYKKRLAGDENYVAIQDDNGNTLLHLAAFHGYLPLVRLAINSGADVDQRNNDGIRAIHLALYDGMGGKELFRPANHYIAAALLEAGADYDIWVASAAGDTVRVRELLAKDAGLVDFHNGARRYPGASSYPLAIAIREGHPDIVRLLLEKGADPDLVTPMDTDDHFVESGVPLIWSLILKQTDTANLLLDHGASPNGQIYAGPGVTDSAYKLGDEALIERIIVAGGRPGLYFHCSTNNYLILRELIDRCPNTPAHGHPHAITVLEEILWVGARDGNLNIVNMCLDRMPEPDKNGKVKAHDFIRNQLLRQVIRYSGAQDDWTPYLTVLARILEFGFNADETDEKHGATALHFISSAVYFRPLGDESVLAFAELLMDHGADVNAIDRESNMTPLATAVRYGRASLVAALLKRGADPLLAGTPETAPLSIAEHLGYSAIAQILRK